MNIKSIIRSVQSTLGVSKISDSIFGKPTKKRKRKSTRKKFVSRKYKAKKRKKRYKNKY